MVGGLGPASTVTYYQKIIEGFRERTGDGSYPYMVINSVDMSSVLDCMERKDYDTLLRLLSTAVEKLKRAGAGFAFIASNTPHIVFPALKSASPIPLVSIVDATVRNACRAKYKKVLLPGWKRGRRKSPWTTCKAATAAMPPMCGRNSVSTNGAPGRKNLARGTGSGAPSRNTAPFTGMSSSPRS